MQNVGKKIKQIKLGIKIKKNLILVLSFLLFSCVAQASDSSKKEKLVVKIVISENPEVKIVEKIDPNEFTCKSEIESHLREKWDKERLKHVLKQLFFNVED